MHNLLNSINNHNFISLSIDSKSKSSWLYMLLATNYNQIINLILNNFYYIIHKVSDMLYVL